MQLVLNRPAGTVAELSAHVEWVPPVLGWEGLGAPSRTLTSLQQQHAVPSPRQRRRRTGARRPSPEHHAVPHRGRRDVHLSFAVVVKRFRTAMAWLGYGLRVWWPLKDGSTPPEPLRATITAIDTEKKRKFRLHFEDGTEDDRWSSLSRKKVRFELDEAVQASPEGSTLAPRPYYIGSTDPGCARAFLEAALAQAPPTWPPTLTVTLSLDSASLTDSAPPSCSPCQSNE